MPPTPRTGPITVRMVWAGAGSFVRMGGALQLVGGIGQRREGKGFAVGHPQGEGRGGAAGRALLVHRQRVGAHMHAAVLGAPGRRGCGASRSMRRISPPYTGRGRSPRTGRSQLTRAAGLHRGKAHPEQRQFGRVFGPMVAGIHPQGAACDGIAEIRRGSRHRGEAEGIGDPHAAVRLPGGGPALQFGGRRRPPSRRRWPPGSRSPGRSRWERATGPGGAHARSTRYPLSAGRPGPPRCRRIAGQSPRPGPPG